MFRYVKVILIGKLRQHKSYLAVSFVLAPQTIFQTLNSYNSKQPRSSPKIQVLRGVMPCRFTSRNDATSLKTLSSATPIREFQISLPHNHYACDHRLQHSQGKAMHRVEIEARKCIFVL